MSGNFYRAFEERYRGSRELISERLNAYKPFTAPLAAAWPGGEALDLGCGRGEWLELTASEGFTAFGVDLDEGMLAACRERGLHVATMDALSALRARPDASIALISAFHLVEHIPFDAAQELVAESLRVLKPGGLLIMETPNPENLIVGTDSFYLDPSHIKPIPILLLDFLVEYAGFARHAVVRLQGIQADETDSAVGLRQVLEGVSPDYSVVAQKGADAAMLAPFDGCFATKYGVALNEMAERFDHGLRTSRAEIAATLTNLRSHAAQSAALDLQANEHGRAIASTDASLRDITEQFDRRLAVLEAGSLVAPIEHTDFAARLDALESTQFASRMDALEAQWQTLPQKWDAALADQLMTLDMRLKASSDELETNAARREIALDRRIEQTGRRIDPMAEHLAALQMHLQDAAAQTEASQQRADQSMQRLAAVEDALFHERARAQQAEAELGRLHRHIDAMTRSSSWRVTSPIRFVSGLGKRAAGAVQEGRILSGLSRRLKPELSSTPEIARVIPASAPALGLRQRIKHSSAARRVALPLLRRFPKLEGPLRRITDSPLQPLPAQAPPAALTGRDAGVLLPAEYVNMPESARTILLDLARTGQEHIDRADSRADSSSSP